MPLILPLAAVAISLLCMLLVWGTGYLIRLLTNWNVGWAPIRWVIRASLALPVTLLQGMENLILPALHPMEQFFGNMEKAAATFVEGVVNYVLHLNDKTNANHRAAGAAGAAAKTAQKDYAGLLHHVNSLESVAPIAKVANTTAANLKAFEHHLDAAVLPGIVQSISAAEHKAIQRSESYTTAAVASLNDIYHRRLHEVVPAHISIPGWAEATIPIALAGVIAQVLPLAEMADTCFNPMCADYAAATAALEGLIAGLGAVGVLSFLVNAINSPGTFGRSVGEAGDEMGAAAESLWQDLGLPLPGASDKPPTGL